MGLFGSKYRYKPSDYSNWQMDPMAIDQQDLRGSGGATGGGMIRGDTAVQKEYQPNLREGGNRIDGRDALSLILASVSDAMARNRGYEANASDNVWAPRMNAMQMAREAQAAQQARAEGLQDYEAKQRIDQRYAPAKINDTEADYNFMVQTVGKEAADGWLRNRGDPMVNTTLPNGQFYSGPQSGLPMALGGGQPQAAPPKPVGRLTPIGGAAAPASPPFLPLQGGIPRRRR